MSKNFWAFLILFSIWASTALIAQNGGSFTSGAGSGSTTCGSTTNGVCTNTSGVFASNAGFTSTIDNTGGSFVTFTNTGIDAFDGVTTGALNIGSSNRGINFGAEGGGATYANIGASGFVGYGFSSYVAPGGHGRDPALSGCSAGSYLGGGTVGSFVSGTTGTCTVTLTPEDVGPAHNGWACIGMDITHPAMMILTTLTTASFTLSGTTTSGDTIVYQCIGF